MSALEIPAPRDPPDLVEHCRTLARTRPGDRAFVWLADGEVETSSLTFGELDARARALGEELERRGLAGERALLVYSGGLEFVCAFLGCLYARVVAVPLSPPRGSRGAARLAPIVEHADPALVLCDRAQLEGLRAAPAVLGGLELLATDSLGLPGRQGWRPGPIDPESLAFLQYTSGSTGSPKGVQVSHRNLVRDEQMIRAGFETDPSTIWVGWLPLFHDMGLVGNVLHPLFLGGQSVLMPPAAFIQRPLRWLQAISRYRGTVAGAPDFAYELCVQKARPHELAGLDLSGWKVAYNGSEPVRARTLERFSTTFAPVGFRREAFYPCYGMAEATLFVSGGRVGEPCRRLEVDAAALEAHRVQPARPSGSGPSAEPGPSPSPVRTLVSCGRAWLDQRILIVDPGTRREFAEDTVGEIWLQGGNVALGYRPPLAEPDAFRARLRDGSGPFLRTGDLGFLHEGELYVTGRLKDVLVLKGRNHYPQDVELAAGGSHPHLRMDRAAAFTLEEQHEERLVVALEVQRTCRGELAPRSRDDPAPLADELTGAVRRAVACEHGLAVWRVVLVEPGGLPRTSSGKLQRRRCRELFSRGELPVLAPSSPGDLLSIP